MPTPTAARKNGETNQFLELVRVPNSGSINRTAGRTVANETAPKSAPATAFGETPVYHQFFSRRSTSSKMSQKSTLATQLAIQSDGVTSGDRPRRSRASPSSAIKTPA